MKTNKGKKEGRLEMAVNRDQSGRAKEIKTEV
jgi:hypothetical protein